MKTRMKEARKDAGMTQQEAAARFGVSLGTYRNWEQGRVVMNGEQLVQAATIFGTNVDYLLMTDTASDDFVDELVGCYLNLSDQGRMALLAISREFEDLFPRDEGEAEKNAVMAQASWEGEAFDSGKGW